MRACACQNFTVHVSLQFAGLCTSVKCWRKRRLFVLIISEEKAWEKAWITTKQYILWPLHHWRSLTKSCVGSLIHISGALKPTLCFALWLNPTQASVQVKLLVWARTKWAPSRNSPILVLHNLRCSYHVMQGSIVRLQLINCRLDAYIQMVQAIQWTQAWGLQGDGAHDSAHVLSTALNIWETKWRCNNIRSQVLTNLHWVSCKHHLRFDWPGRDLCWLFAAIIYRHFVDYN